MRKYLDKPFSLPLLALALQLTAALLMHISYTLNYQAQINLFTSLESVITYLLLIIAGFIAGAIALIGFYRLISQASPSTIMLVGVLVCLPSLFFAGLSIYALLIFLALV